MSVSGPSIVSASTGLLALAPDDAATLGLSPSGGGAGQTPSGDYEGDVELDCGGTLLRVPWWVRIDRKGKP